MDKLDFAALLATKSYISAAPLKILAVLRTNIAPEFFRDTVAETAAQTAGPREVILSEYLEILPSPLREGRGEGEKSG